MTLNPSSIGSARPGDDARNGAWVNAQLIGETCVGSTIGVAEDDVGNIFVRKLPDAGHFDAGFNRMGMVAEPSNPFEVGYEIIRLDRVDMVDLGQVLRVWDKRSSDNSMNGNIAEDRAFSQVNVDIALSVNEQLHIATFEVTRPFRSKSSADHLVAYSVQAAYATKITDLVKLLEPSDGDGAPLFSDFRCHEANSPVEMLANINMAFDAKQLN